MHRESLVAISWCLVIAAAVVVMLEVHRHHETVAVPLPVPVPGPGPMPQPPDSRGGNVTVTLPEPVEEESNPQFFGNTESHKFHRKTCGYLDRCVNCTAHFHTRDEALKAGYRPCGHCDP